MNHMPLGTSENQFVPWFCLPQEQCHVAWASLGLSLLPHPTCSDHRCATLRGNNQLILKIIYDTTVGVCILRISLL